MTVTTLQAAQACYDLYAYADPPVTKWTFVSPPDAICYYGVVDLGSTVLVCFRGATTLEDLALTLESYAEAPSSHPYFHTEALGPVHPGAWTGLVDVLTSLTKEFLPGKEIQFTGHSLGAMRATLATALFNASFTTGTAQPRICFGECASGYKTSADLSAIPGSRSVVSMHDGIHDPLYHYPVLPGYTHGIVPTTLQVTPDGSSPPEFVGPIALHYMGYYLKALM